MHGRIAKPTAMNDPAAKTSQTDGQVVLGAVPSRLALPVRLAGWIQLSVLMLWAIAPGCSRDAPTRREISRLQTDIASLQKSRSEVEARFAERHRTMRSIDERLRRLEERQQADESDRRNEGGAAGYPPPRSAARPVSKLLQGSYTDRSGALLFSADARLRLPDNTEISSPTGMMLSSPEQDIVAGDLTVENGNGVLHTTDAVVELQAGTTNLEAEQMVFTSSKREGTPSKSDQRR